MRFENYKKDILSRQDKSRAGGIDKPVAMLVEGINQNPHYCTTSSCSGRIIILGKLTGKKKDMLWLYVSHESATFAAVEKALAKLPKCKVYLRFEPVILHVAADTTETALELINIARMQGLKRSGIQSIKPGRVVCELCGVDIIDTFVADKGEMLVSKEYLELLVDECNVKLDANFARICSLQKEIEKLAK